MAFSPLFGGFSVNCEILFFSRLFRIQQQVFHLHQTFKIIWAGNGQEIATVRKTFNFLRAKFEIESIYGRYELQSVNVWAHSFTLVKGGRVVAAVSKAYFTMTDSYGVEIAGDEYHAFILALIIVLDQVLYDKN